MSIPIVKQFDDLAESMANPNPDRPIQEAVAAFGRTVCNRISARPDVWTPTILQSPLRAACQPYWDSQNFDGPVETTTIPTGQCPTQYRFTWSTSGFPETPIQFASLVGPLSEPIRVPGFNRLWQVTNGFGSTFNIGSQINGTQANFDGWERVDGQPDNCGEPVTTFDPGPNPAPDPGPLPPGTGPTVNVRSAVVLVLPGAVQITPTLNVELPIGEINLGSGTGGGPAADPLPGDELAGEGSGTGGGENDFGDPPDGERWVGCCVRITLAPVGSGVIPSSIPHDVYPIIVGNARLKFQGPGGPVTYDTPIQKRQETSCLWEPVRGMAPIGCFVNLLPGYNYAIQPYSVPLEQ